jgi:hypothetical protein
VIGDAGSALDEFTPAEIMMGVMKIIHDESRALPREERRLFLEAVIGFIKGKGK